MLVHDLVCTRQGIGAASGPIKEAILRHKTRLKSEYVRAQLSRKDKPEGTHTCNPCSQCRGILFDCAGGVVY